MTPLRTRRGGAYYRVCDPSWEDPGDTSFSKSAGGRWNAKGEFGALYLNATIEVAAANARRSLRQHFGDVVTFSDIRPERRPDLQVFTVRSHLFVDAISDKGLSALALPDSYPRGATKAACQAVSRILYRAHEAGIAVRSAVAHSGEELAIFDTHVRQLAKMKRNGRISFPSWYPGLF